MKNSNPMKVVIDNAPKDLLVLQLVNATKVISMYDNMFYNIIMNKKSGVFLDMIKAYRKAQKLLDNEFNSDISKVQWYNRRMGEICQVFAHDVKGLTKKNWEDYAEDGPGDRIDYELIRQVSRIGLAIGLQTARNTNPDSFNKWAEKNKSSEHTAHTLKKQTQYYAKMVIDASMMLMRTQSAPMDDGIDRDSLSKYLQREFGISLEKDDD